MVAKWNSHQKGIQSCRVDRFQLPAGIGKITHIGCCYRCVVVVTEEGDIYFRKKFVAHEHEDLTTGVMKTTS